MAGLRRLEELSQENVQSLSTLTRRNREMLGYLLQAFLPIHARVLRYQVRPGYASIVSGPSADGEWEFLGRINRALDGDNSKK